MLYLDKCPENVQVCSIIEQKRISQMNLQLLPESVLILLVNKGSQNHPNKGKQMTTAPKVEKAPKVLDAQTQANYAHVLHTKEESNTANFAFLSYVAGCLMTKKLSQEVLEDSIKAESAHAKITAEFKSSHVKSAVVAQYIVKNFPEVLDAPIAKVLTMAGRVLDDVKSAGAQAHIKNFSSFAELDEGTLTKAESQARDKGVSLDAEIVEKASAITFETGLQAFSKLVIEQVKLGGGFDKFTTKEIELLKSTMAALNQIKKNTEKAAA